MTGLQLVRTQDSRTGYAKAQSSFQSAHSESSRQPPPPTGPFSEDLPQPSRPMSMAPQRYRWTQSPTWQGMLLELNCF